MRIVHITVMKISLLIFCLDISTVPAFLSIFFDL